MTAVMTTLMPFNEEIRTVFCTDNMTKNQKSIVKISDGNSKFPRKGIPRNHT